MTVSKMSAARVEEGDGSEERFEQEWNLRDRGVSDRTGGSRVRRTRGSKGRVG